MINACLKNKRSKLIVRLYFELGSPLQSAALTFDDNLRATP